MNITKQLLDHLTSFGIKRIEISYTGFDGDGTITDVRYRARRGFVNEDSIGNQFTDHVYDLIQDYLSTNHVGWNDGEGSSGTIVFNLQTLEVINNHREREIVNRSSTLKDAIVVTESDGEKIP